MRLIAAEAMRQALANAKACRRPILEGGLILESGFAALTAWVLSGWWTPRTAAADSSGHLRRNPASLAR